MNPEFVELIPENLQDGVVYVSLKYNIVAHKCCCGCGEEVVTPLSPTDWKLTYNGESISLHPSIGNWNFNCKSHYWIKNNQIKWADRWTEEEIKIGRSIDEKNKKKYYQSKKTVIETESASTQSQSENVAIETKQNFWSRIKNWFSK